MSQQAPILAVGVSMPNMHHPVPVRLGDTVWFYPSCNFDTTPQVAVLTRLQEGHMADLSIVPIDGFRTTPVKGVHLFGDDRLNNPNIRKTGCWVPRPPAEQLIKV